jgi:hypothetical protein
MAEGHQPDLCPDIIPEQLAIYRSGPSATLPAGWVVVHDPGFGHERESRRV